MEIEVTAPIAEVTVYPDRALVIRRGEASVESAGEHALRIAGLPLNILRASLRATGSGPAGIRILGVEQTEEFHPAAPEETLSRLRDEIARVTREMALLDERLRLLDDQRSWLTTLGEQTARSLAYGVMRGTAKPEDAGALFTYTGAEAQRLATDRLDAQHQREDLSRQLDALNREYAAIGGAKRPDRLSASVRIALTTSGTVALQLSYLVIGASWRPRYDARVDRAGARVRLTQQAVLTQRTGEAWKGVTLSLSNAQPGAAISLPDEPDPWYLDVAQPPQLMFAAAMAAPMAAQSSAKRSPNRLAAAMPSAGAMGGAFGDMAMDMAAPTPPPMVEAEQASAQMERAGAAQIFHVSGGADIPSDGSPHIVGMSDDDLPCQLEYVAEPVVALGAHLRAKASNTTGHVLLAGELHVFHTGASGEEYVGMTTLDVTAEDAPLTLYLGADDNVTVKRELIERDTDKGSLLQSGIRRVTLGYRVTLANRTTAPQRMILKDRLPVPRHERIKLRTLDIRPQPTARTPLEQLTWELQLNPGEERRIEWRFVVESPTDLSVKGLP
ncbi:MAG: mucoidy inhibitor MuiA family protein [Ktedonobacterales bacterium]